MNAPPLLEAKGLTKVFKQRWTTGKRVELAAVSDVDVVVARGETVGVVGESGAGKSTLGRLVLRLIEPDAGTIQFDGRNLRALGSREMRRMRAQLQMVFQDPYSSLDPTMTIRESVSEPLKLHSGLSRQDRFDVVNSLFERVGLRASDGDRYPSSFSGGQLQRIAIARSLASEPSLIVCDEPVAALDMSIRGQVLNLLAGLQEERGLAYLFISHDLSIVEHFVHRVIVMYAGRVVETGLIETIYSVPEHPYTRALLAAVPVADPSTRLKIEKGRRVEQLAAAEMQQGCPYRNRCIQAMEICTEVMPDLVTRADGRQVACHLYVESSTTSARSSSLIVSATNAGASDTGGGDARDGASATDIGPRSVPLS
jgi:oligopeptide/dipeptide ABC transporter ATP-binding protein